MKREIKFRGFERSTGKWRYGHFSQGHTEWYIKSEKEGVWEVPYDSVGQFTGLHDKNCTEIYEGDILKENEHGIFEVVWEQSQCKFSLDWTRTSPSIQYPGWNRGIKMEVIGNIYEHPHLLTPTTSNNETK